MNNMQNYIIEDAKYILHEFEVHSPSGYKVVRFDITRKDGCVFLNWTFGCDSEEEGRSVFVNRYAEPLLKKATIRIGKRGGVSYYDVWSRKYKRSAELLDAIRDAERYGEKAE